MVRMPCQEFNCSIFKHVPIFSVYALPCFLQLLWMLEPAQEASFFSFPLRAPSICVYNLIFSQYVQSVFNVLILLQILLRLLGTSSPKAVFYFQIQVSLPYNENEAAIVLKILILFLFAFCCCVLRMILHTICIFYYIHEYICHSL